MRVFVLGGTGSIGTAVIQALDAAGHQIVGLCRSDAAAQRITDLGAQPVRGDLRNPQGWIDMAMRSDGVIHVAATFEDDMGDVDAAVVAALVRAAPARDRPLRVLYTGGCWLYGETGDTVATEDHSFNPLEDFAWMVRHGQQLLNAPMISTAIVHPAMVYHPSGGAFERFLDAAKAGEAVEIWGTPKTRWPLIHRDDLAQAYLSLLTRTDLTGHFNAVGEEGVAVEDIVQTLNQYFANDAGQVSLSLEEVIVRYGTWAEGPTLDQQMSAQKLHSAVGWVPAHTDFRSIAW